MKMVQLQNAHGEITMTRPGRCQLRRAEFIIRFFDRPFAEKKGTERLPANVTPIYRGGKLVGLETIDVSEPMV